MGVPWSIARRAAYKPPNHLPNRVCPVCSKPFYRHPSAITNAKHGVVCCSKDCQYQARVLGIVPRVVEHPYIYSKPSTKIEKQCVVCSKTFKVIPSLVESRKTCSRQCFEKKHSVEMSGSRNPAYKDGQCRLKRCYRGIGWEASRKACYERDNYICQKCGIDCKENRPQAHHIFPYIDGGTNDLSNLMTLCVKCHMKIEAFTNVLLNQLNIVIAFQTEPNDYPGAGT